MGLRPLQVAIFPYCACDMTVFGGIRAKYDFKSTGKKGNDPFANEIYSQFSKNSIIDPYHNRANSTCHSSTNSATKRNADIEAAMDRLKNNEFIPIQTYETFLARKQGGKRMHFVNKPTSEPTSEFYL